MKVIRDGLWLCVDCTIVACNGDYSGFDYTYGNDAAARGARIAEVNAGLDRLGRGLVPDFDSESGEGVEDFMRAPIGGCAGCGSPLAGSFHRFAVLGPDDAP